MKLFTLTIHNKAEMHESEIIDFLEKSALAEGYSIEENKIIFESFILKLNRLSFNIGLIKRLSGLPYLIVNYNSKSRKIELSLCDNFLTILSTFISLFLIFLVLFFGIKKQFISGVIFPSLYLLIMISSAFIRLRPFFNYRRLIVNGIGV